MKVKVPLLCMAKVGNCLPFSQAQLDLTSVVDGYQVVCVRDDDEKMIR